MLSIFESSERRRKDVLEVQYLYTRYGDDTLSVLRERARDQSSTTRDRKHWKRILRKAKSQVRETSNYATS